MAREDLLGMKRQHADTEPIAFDDEQDVGGDLPAAVVHNQPVFRSLADVIEGRLGNDVGKPGVKLSLVMLQPGQLQVIEGRPA